MNRKTYDRTAAQALLPLLDSILREMEDRRKQLSLLENARRRLDGKLDDKDDEVRYLVADIATQKRGLRHASEELERLGCTVEDGNLSLVRIPGANDGWVWQPNGELQEATPAAA